MKKDKKLTVTAYLEEIIKDLEIASGYPYPADWMGDPAKAFAYGYAIGLLTQAKEAWDRKVQ